MTQLRIGITIGLVLLALGGILLLPAGGTAEATETNICSGEYECLPGLVACEDNCFANAQPGQDFRQCMRACLQVYKDCTIAACAL